MFHHEKPASLNATFKDILLPIISEPLLEGAELDTQMMEAAYSIVMMLAHQGIAVSETGNHLVVQDSEDSHNVTLCDMHGIITKFAANDVMKTGAEAIVGKLWRRVKQVIVSEAVEINEAVKAAQKNKSTEKTTRKAPFVAKKTSMSAATSSLE